MSIFSSAKQVVRTATAALFASALVFAGATSASAHDILLESNPEDGATLTKTTNVIVLSFNNNVAELGGKILITPKGGEKIEADLKANGRDAVLEMETPLANNEYSVAWRVVSSDSHPIEGAFTFTVDDPANPTTADTETPSEEPSTEPTSEPAATPSETASSEPSSTPTAEENDSSNGGINWGRIGVFGGLGALVGVVLVVLGNKRNKNKK